MAQQSKITVGRSIAESFLLRAALRPKQAAMREKDFGIWRKISWADWLRTSKELAYGLHALGFAPGDVASIIGNTNPEWCYADMGVLCAGGISSGIYPTDSAKQVEYLLNDSASKVVFVEDDEQLDKVLECRLRCPILERIVIFNMEGLQTFKDPMAMSLDVVEFDLSGVERETPTNGVRLLLSFSLNKSLKQSLCAARGWPSISYKP